MPLLALFNNPTQNIDRTFGLPGITPTIIEPQIELNLRVFGLRLPEVIS